MSPRDFISTAAGDYCARGWRVFPLNGKVPFGGTHGVLDASSDPGRIAGWPAASNIGIAGGNGLVILDVDPRHGGEDSLHELERRHGQLPRTVSAETGTGGTHYYFATHKKVACSAGALGDGLDVRGDGGYVVAPPSVHPETGRRYVWDNAPEETPPARLPAWLAGRLEKASIGQARSVEYWRQVTVEGAGEGERNDRLVQLTGHLLARGVDPFVAHGLLMAWNRQFCKPPLLDGDVMRTVDSIAKRELEKWQ
jgi:hypothetical protein